MPTQNSQRTSSLVSRGHISRSARRWRCVPLAATVPPWLGSPSPLLCVRAVQEYKSAAASANAQTSPTSPQDPHNPVPLSKPLSQLANGARPVVTGPQPLRPLDRRPSQGAHRNRSPSASATSTALQDLAHQGKRQLNQLMTFLDRDGTRSDNALRQVRAKREADEAGWSITALLSALRLMCPGAQIRSTGRASIGLKPSACVGSRLLSPASR